MLCNMKSPSSYMQAAFRAQNPCLFHEGTNSYRKENAYVFDFDPARTLIIFEEFANDLNSNTVRGLGTAEQRLANVKELLNSDDTLKFESHIKTMSKGDCLYSVVKAFSELDLSPEHYDSIKMGYIFENLIIRRIRNIRFLQCKRLTQSNI